MDHLCNQERRIERIEGAVENLARQFSEFVNEFRTFRAVIQPVIDKVTEHEEVLYGEKGATGMISTVHATKETMDELKVALKGEGKETGLISEIKSLNEFNAKVRERDVWLTRLVAGSVVTGAIAYFLSLVLN